MSHHERTMDKWSYHNETNQSVVWTSRETSWWSRGCKRNSVLALQGPLVGKNTSPVFWKQKLVEGGEEGRRDMFLHEHRAAQLDFLPSAGGPQERVGTGL